MAYKTVAVAGATGTLGPWIVNALLEAGFKVTTLSRTGKTDTQDRGGKKTGSLPSQARTIQVDYSSPESLVSALTGQDAVVSNLTDYDTQLPLMKAAIEAGVQRFIPAEFGSNVSGNAKNAALPCFKNSKVAAQRDLQQHADKMSYTIVVNGFFLDWGIETGILLPLKGGTMRIFDGGDSKHSLSLRSDIGKAVAGILKHPDETKNRTVYVQSASISQKDLIDIGKKVKPGFEPQLEHVTTQQVLDKSYAGLEKGGENIMPAMLGFILVSCFSTDGYGNDWADRNDNEFLGIKEVSAQELEDLVRKSA